VSLLTSSMIVSFVSGARYPNTGWFGKYKFWKL
jgi:hypothetical protein